MTSSTFIDDPRLLSPFTAQWLSLDRWIGDHWRDLLAIVGLAMAIAELHRIARVTEATRRAVDRTSAALARNFLLLLLPQLRHVEQEFVASVARDSAPDVVRLLTTWRHLSSEVRGRIGDDSGAQPLVAELKASTALSATAIRAVLKQGRTLEETTRRVHESMAKVCDEAGAVLARLSLEIGETK